MELTLVSFLPTMSNPNPAPARSVLQRLREDRPLATVELRPPRTGLSSADTMELWIDMYHAIQRLIRRDTIIFLTDNAVGLSDRPFPDIQALHRILPDARIAGRFERV